MNHLRFFYYLIIVLILVSLWCICLLLYGNKKNKAAFVFLAFLFQSIFYYTIFFIETYIQNTQEFPLSVQQIWELGQYIEYFRWLLLFYVIWSFFKVSFTYRAMFIISLFIISGYFIFSQFFPLLPDYFTLGLLFFYSIFIIIHNKKLNVNILIDQKILYIFTLILSLMLVLRVFDLIITLPFVNIHLAILLTDIEPIFWLIFCGLIGRSYIKEAMTMTFKKNHKLISLSVDFLEKYSISPRETDVLDYLLKGYPNSEIAQKLYISQSTVKKHINSIFKKFNIKTRWQLLSLARGEDLCN